MIIDNSIHFSFQDLTKVSGKTKKLMLGYWPYIKLDDSRITIEIKNKKNYESINADAKEFIEAIGKGNHVREMERYINRVIDQIIVDSGHDKDQIEVLWKR